MDLTGDEHDLALLVATLEDLTAGVRRLQGQTARAWSEVGPTAAGQVAEDALLVCTFCATPIMDGYRRASRDPRRVAHVNRKECLETIRNIAVFALDTYIGIEPAETGPATDLPF